MGDDRARYTAQIISGSDAAGLAACHRLRSASFRADRGDAHRGGRDGGRDGDAPAAAEHGAATEHGAANANAAAKARDVPSDADEFDALCDHLLIEDRRRPEGARAIATLRLLRFDSAREMAARSYSGKVYDLTALRRYPGRVVEVGRFCIDPDCRDPLVLRLALSTVARYAVDHGVSLLFGCSSFDGEDAERHAEALTLLAAHHAGPRRWLPRIRAPRVFRPRLRLPKFDMDKARKALPPLLRGYLSFGAWVSDHAVVDTDLRTVHVFTALEVRHVPPRVRRALGVA